MLLSDGDLPRCAIRYSFPCLADTYPPVLPGSKLRHFKSIHKKTGIPYAEMLFFDDEARNKEVESLGYVCPLRLVPGGDS